MLKCHKKKGTGVDKRLAYNRQICVLRSCHHRKKIMRFPHTGYVRIKNSRYFLIMVVCHQKNQNLIAKSLQHHFQHFWIWCNKITLSKIKNWSLYINKNAWYSEMILLLSLTNVRKNFKCLLNDWLFKTTSTYLGQWFLFGFPICKGNNHFFSNNLNGIIKLFIYTV